MRKILVLAGLLALGACSKEPQTAENSSATTAGGGQAQVASAAANPNAPPPAFSQCAVCHKSEKDAPNGLGPNLWGVFGRHSASVQGFAYSPAMKSANYSWDETTLDLFLTKPQAIVPGTRMSFAGIADAGKRAEIIAWLKTRK